MEMPPARILCYVSARRGTGHLMRQATILRAVNRLAPSVQIHILLNADDSTVLAPGEFPTTVAAATDSHCLNDLLHSFSPDLLLFDTLLPRDALPHGLSPQPACALTLRTIRRERLPKLFGNAWSQWLRLFIIPHEESEFGLDLPIQRGQKVVYTGPIVRDDCLETALEMRQKYGLTERDFVVVASAGGGGMPEFFRSFQTCVLDAFRRIRRHMPDVKLILVTGAKNEFSPVGEPGLVTVSIERNLPTLFRLASLVIAHGGYNTTNEILHASVPIVFLPCPAKYDDGLRRAQECVQRGVAYIISDFDSEKMAEFIIAFRNDGRTRAKMQGAYRNVAIKRGNEIAAHAVLELLQDHKDEVACAALPLSATRLSFRSKKTISEQAGVEDTAASEQVDPGPSDGSQFVIPVLSYHAVDPAINDAWCVQPPDFCRQLDWLALHARVIGLPEAMDLMRKDESAPPDAIVITFDDGYAGLLDHALPELEGRQMTATVFLITGYMGKWNKWNSRAKYMATHLTWDQAAELANRGFTVGSHSRSHHALVKFNRERIKRELHGSANDIREALGIDPRFVAYPYGSFNEIVTKVAQKRYDLGFASGMKGSCDWHAAPMQIHRVAVQAHWSVEQLAAQIHRYGTS